MVATDDLKALREYVTAPSTGVQQQSDSTVVLHITHCNLKMQMMELRFDLHVSAQSHLLSRASRDPKLISAHLCRPLSEGSRRS